LRSKKTQWKTQFELVDSSSKLHRRVGEIFATDPFFKTMRCFQEVPVAALVPDYSNNSHCIDWYVQELATVVEVHGEQHYKETNFGNISAEESRKAFNRMRFRDNLKKTALEEAGYEYREIDFRTARRLTPGDLKRIVLGE